MNIHRTQKTPIKANQKLKTILLNINKFRIYYMRYNLLIILLIVVLTSGCAQNDSLKIIPSEEELETLEEIEEHSKQTIEKIGPAELDLSDPLIAKCKEELDKCKQQMLENDNDLTFDILKMEKFEGSNQFNDAEAFYNNYKGLAQSSVISELSNAGYNILNINTYSLVLAANKVHLRPEVWKELGHSGPPNELPKVTICINGGTLLRSSKDAIGC